MKRLSQKWHLKISRWRRVFHAVSFGKHAAITRGRWFHLVEASNAKFTQWSTFYCEFVWLLWRKLQPTNVGKAQVDSTLFVFDSHGRFRIQQLFTVFMTQRWICRFFLLHLCYRQNETARGRRIDLLFVIDIILQIVNYHIETCTEFTQVVKLIRKTTQLLQSKTFSKERRTQQSQELNQTTVINVS